jgi:hypothetical protein
MAHGRVWPHRLRTAVTSMTPSKAAVNSFLFGATPTAPAAVPVAMPTPVPRATATATTSFGSVVVLGRKEIIPGAALKAAAPAVAPVAGPVPATATSPAMSPSRMGPFALAAAAFGKVVRSPSVAASPVGGGVPAVAPGMRDHHDEETPRMKRVRRDPAGNDGSPKMGGGTALEMPTPMAATAASTTPATNPRRSAKVGAHRSATKKVCAALCTGTPLRMPQADPRTERARLCVAPRARLPPPWPKMDRRPGLSCQQRRQPQWPRLRRRPRVPLRHWQVRWTHTLRGRRVARLG